MRLDHIALWTCRLEALRSFYELHFGAVASPKYTNPKKGFSSYFLRFESGARMEIMTRADITEPRGGVERLGYVHVAISVGSEAAVVEITERLRKLGVPVESEPRRTGDGYFESVILDPEGNRIELTV